MSLFVKREGVDFTVNWLEVQRNLDGVIPWSSLRQFIEAVFGEDIAEFVVGPGYTFLKCLLFLCLMLFGRNVRGMMFSEMGAVRVKIAVPVKGEQSCHELCVTDYLF